MKDIIQTLKAHNQENEIFLANYFTPRFLLHKMKDIDWNKHP